MTHIKELRKVYDDGYLNGDAPGANTQDPHKAAIAFHDAALLAVARYSAQRQRDMEPTEKMKEYGRDAAGMHVIGQWDTDEEQEETLEFIVEALNSREELDRLRAEREGRVQMMRRLHDQIGMMIDQVGQPDYSLRELVNEMRGIRDVLLAAAEEESRG